MGTERADNGPTRLWTARLWATRTPGSPTMGRARRIALMTIVIALLHTMSMVGAPGIAGAGGSTGNTNNFDFAGSGYGHGVGMSQWGARGLAEQGRNATQILTHYYTGTTVGTTPVINDLRVLVGQKLSQADVGVFGTATIKNGDSTVGTATGWFKATRSGNNVVLSGAINKTVPGHVTLALTSPTRLTQSGHSYARGSMLIRTDPAGGLRVIVYGLTMDNYLRGLGEMPALWPMEALKAQAIAGRTYAQKVTSSKDRPSSDFDLYDGTIHQAYNGYDIESATHGERWVNAVTSTTNRVVKYGSALIDAVYSSSSGGHTANSEAVWVTKVPYLRGVPDPADRVASNPHNSWKKSYTGTSLGSAMGIGKVTRVDVDNGGSTGRLDKVNLRFHTAGGVKVFTGTQVKTKLALKSTRFTVNGIGTASTTLARGSLHSLFVWDKDRSTIVAGGTAVDPDGPVKVVIAYQSPQRLGFHQTTNVNGSFLAAFKVPKGDYKVCAALVDNPTGTNVQIGCKQVVVK